jgi:hypothetical protein
MNTNESASLRNICSEPHVPETSPAGHRLAKRLATFAAFLAVALGLSGFMAAQVASAAHVRQAACVLIFNGYGPSGPSFHTVCRWSHQGGPRQW